MLSRGLGLVILAILALLALIPSYMVVENIELDVEARVECRGRTAFVLLKNNGEPCRIHYMTVTEGDNVLKILEVNQVLDTGEKLFKLDIPSNKSKISIIFDRGVIGGLSCDTSARSQP